ncbi:unnamed protein product, partial [Hapterophycus canaliculatus]
METLVCPVIFIALGEPVLPSSLRSIEITEHACTTGGGRWLKMHGLTPSTPHRRSRKNRTVGIAIDCVFWNVQKAHKQDQQTRPRFSIVTTGESTRALNAFHPISTTVSTPKRSIIETKEGRNNSSLSRWCCRIHRHTHRSATFGPFGMLPPAAPDRAATPASTARSRRGRQVFPTIATADAADSADSAATCTVFPFAVRPTFAERINQP